MAKQKYPNILFILSDDQGAWAMGCYGNREIHTPNLDRLAEEGVRFEHFFCASPVCSPARASLLTGRIPSQHGVHDYLCEGNGGCGQRAIQYLEGQTGYTDLLCEAGYECALSGKWHLGDGAHPQKGFTFWYTHQKGGGPYYNAPMFRDGQPVTEPGYITDVITDEALRFLDGRDREKPFYLSVHYTAPHSPWVGCHPQEYVDLYRDCPFHSCPQEPAHPWANVDVLPGYKDPIPNLQGYYAAVTAMDANIGRLLDRLEAENLAEDTLVIYTSDNGFNCGQHGIWGKGNGTFPLNMYDSSVQVPFLARHPGHIPEGRVCERMVSAYDFLPTLMEYLGLDNPLAGDLPGRSFAPWLRGEQAPEERPVVVFDEYGPVRMIRTQTRKYVRRLPYGPDEFYCLDTDPGERENRIGDPACAEEIAQMRRQLDGWFVRYADPAIDGSREPVRGGGQAGLAGLWGDGHDVYPVNDHC